MNVDGKYQQVGETHDPAVQDLNWALRSYLETCILFLHFFALNSTSGIPFMFTYKLLYSISTICFIYTVLYNAVFINWSTHTCIHCDQYRLCQHYSFSLFNFELLSVIVFYWRAFIAFLTFHTTVETSKGTKNHYSVRISKVRVVRVDFFYIIRNNNSFQKTSTSEFLIEFLPFIGNIIKYLKDDFSHLEKCSSSH